MPRRPRYLPAYCFEQKARKDKKTGKDKYAVYFRRPGQNKVRLRGSPWSPEFMVQYGQAMAEYELTGKGEAPTIGSCDKSISGTWRWLCEQYMACAEFKSLTGTTPSTRRRNLEWTWQQPINPDQPNLKFGDMPISKMTAKAVRVLRDLKAGTNVEHKAAANLLRKIIGYVFVYGLENHSDLVGSNPVRDVKSFDYESDGHHPWTEEEFQQFMDFYLSGTKERRAMALFLYTFARGCDARLFGPQHVKDGRFVFNQKKTNIWVDLPVIDELAAELALAPRGDLAFILTEYGKTFSEKGFGQWFNEKCRKAGLVNCTMHGIRKGAATIAANNGATVHQLMAMFGWMTEQMAIHYTKKANRKTLADAGMKHLRIGQKSADK
ncbi:MAG TPA: tyrosine-type recombinase/integrase [Rhizomicrobium sp.]|nr:tyrosine-type recombinase/integrase [Rhizomicrobium sp.]